MADKPIGGLGMGLGALLKDTKLAATDDTNAIQNIPTGEIQPNRYQPRQDFDESALDELKTSIKDYGVIQPVLVRKLPQGGYELVAGERRLRAAKLAEVETIPAIIREYNDAEISEIALIENIQREDLNIMEEARAYDRLMREFSLTQDAMAQKIGRSRSHIANILRLLNLAPKVQDYVANGSLTMGQAKPLLSLEDENLQCEAAEFIQEKDLSARQTEQLVKRLKEDPEYLKRQEPAAPMEKAPQEQAIYVREAEERLTERLGTQVKILPGKKKSRIQIDFYSEEDLERIIEQLMNRNAEAPHQDHGPVENFTV